METKPENYLSRDTDGFQDKITDLMDDDEAVIGAPGSSRRVMVPIKHVGTRQSRTDTVAGTGLTWNGNETLLVEDAKAMKLLKFPDVWAFDAEYLGANAGVTMDGLVPLTVNVSVADAEAVAEGRAEVMVVYPNAVATQGPQETAEVPADEADTQMTLDELVDALDKPQLLDLAKQEGIDVDERLGVKKLRAQVRTLIAARDAAALAASAGQPE